MRGCAEERGFTLVEVVVAVLLFVVVVGAALALYQQGILSWRREEARVDVQENLRIGLDRMSRELRGALSFEKAGDDFVEFKIRNDKGGVDFISYYVAYSNTARCYQLLRRAGSTANPVASYVTGLTLAYYDADNNPTQNLESIRRVEITLTGRKGNGPEVKMTTSVRVRALD